MVPESSKSQVADGNDVFDQFFSIRWDKHLMATACGQSLCQISNFHNFHLCSSAHISNCARRNMRAKVIASGLLLDCGTAHWKFFKTASVQWSLHREVAGDWLGWSPSEAQAAVASKTSMASSLEPEAAEESQSEWQQNEAAVKFASEATTAMETWPQAQSQQQP